MKLSKALERLSEVWLHLVNIWHLDLTEALYGF